MLRSDFHAALPGQLEGLLAREEIALRALEIHRVVGDFLRAGVHYGRAWGGTLPEGAFETTLREGLGLGIEPLLHRADEFQATRVALAHRSVHSVALHLDEPLASLRHTGVKGAIRRRVLGLLRLPDALLLRLVQILSSQVDRRACSLACSSRLNLVDLRVEGVGANFSRLHDLPGLAPQ